MEKGKLSVKVGTIGCMLGLHEIILLNQFQKFDKP
jgi:hypothetical protein